MTSKQRLATIGLASSLALASLVSWGCGETGDTDPTPVQTFKITPAANATEPPGASAVATSPTIPPPPPSTIVIAGISSTFDEEEIRARAGTITIEFDNRDGGVIHNIHFFRGDDADDESVAQSELEAGPVRQTVVFDAQPGNYYYVCDAHPTTMEGNLTVE